MAPKARKPIVLFGTELNPQQEDCAGWMSFYLLLVLVNAYSAGNGVATGDMGQVVLALLVGGWMLYMANMARNEIESLERRKNKKGRDA